MGPTGPQGCCPMRGPRQVRAGPPTWLRARWKAPSADHSTRQLRLGLATAPPLPEWASPAGLDRSRASGEAGLPPWPSALPHGHHPDSLCASLHVLCLKPQTGTRTRVVADLGGQYQRPSHKAPWHRGEVRAPSSKGEPALPASALGAGTHLCRQT